MKASDLTPEQQFLYEELKKEYLAKLDETESKFNALTKFLASCQRVNTDTVGYFEWQGANGQYSREYRNGDLAEIDATGEIGKYEWRYSDSAGKILAFASETTLTEAEFQCDTYNETFTGKGSN